MSRYKLDDGTIVDTDKATNSWNEERDWDGRNHIGRASRSQWEHQTLYRSAKGRYYVEHSSQWQGSLPRAELVSREQAARWLIHNEHELPQDLSVLEQEVVE